MGSPPTGGGATADIPSVILDLSISPGIRLQFRFDNALMLEEGKCGCRNVQKAALSAVTEVGESAGKLSGEER